MSEPLPASLTLLPVAVRPRVAPAEVRRPYLPDTFEGVLESRPPSIPNPEPPSASRAPAQVPSGRRMARWSRSVASSIGRYGLLAAAAFLTFSMGLGLPEQLPSEQAKTPDVAVATLAALPKRPVPPPAPPAAAAAATAPTPEERSEQVGAVPSPARSFLHVTTSPAGALVALDDARPLGPAPRTLEVETGSTVRITAQLNGYKPQTRTVLVDELETDIEIELQRNRSR